MASRVDIPPELLRQLLVYDSETGLFAWLARPASMFADGKRSAAVSAADWNNQYAGKPALATLSNGGYLYGSIFRKQYKAHRAAFAYHYGYWPKAFIDHVNGIRTDNRIHNLRDATYTENARNRRKHSGNQSGMIGVSWSKKSRKWWVRINHENQTLHLGFFASLEEACSVRKDAERKYGYHPNHGSVLEKNNG